MSLSVSLNFSWQSSQFYEVPVQLFKINQLKNQRETETQNSLIYSVKLSLINNFCQPLLQIVVGDLFHDSGIELVSPWKFNIYFYPLSRIFPLVPHPYKGVSFNPNSN